MILGVCPGDRSVCISVGWLSNTIEMGLVSFTAFQWGINLSFDKRENEWKLVINKIFIHMCHRD